MLWVFGYASLVSPDDVRRTVRRPHHLPVDVRPATLTGYRRGWIVAMANHHDDPTDKHYLRPDGSRPAGTVSHLGIYEHAGTTLNGVVFQVSATELVDLDRRERRYDRVEVSASVTADAAVTEVHVYRPKLENVALNRTSVANGEDRIHRSYHDLVHDAFRSLGPDHHRTYLATTDEPTSPIEDLDQLHPDNGVERSPTTRAEG